MSHVSTSTPSTGFKPTLAPLPSVINKMPEATQHDQLVKQTQKWVAQTFYGTLLKQVRQSPFHSKLFDGGRGGQAFGSLYDQQMAEHMARGTGSKLVNSIVRKIEAKQAYRQSLRKDDINNASKTPSHAVQGSSHVAANLRA